MPGHIVASTAAIVLLAIESWSLRDELALKQTLLDAARAELNVERSRLAAEQAGRLKDRTELLELLAQVQARCDSDYLMAD